jgi:hypothetical protein
MDLSAVRFFITPNGKQMFSDKYRQHWGFSGWQLLTLFSVPLFPKPLSLAGTLIIF